jgi:hypothetical protein
MCHAGIKLVISGPVVSMKADWCLNVVGTTGEGERGGDIRNFIDIYINNK